MSGAWCNRVRDSESDIRPKMDDANTDARLTAPYMGSDNLHGVMSRDEHKCGKHSDTVVPLRSECTALTSKVHIQYTVLGACQSTLWVNLTHEMNVNRALSQLR